MDEIILLKPKDYDEWDNFVARHPLGTIYHTSGWLRVIEETFKAKPFYFFKRDEKGNIKGGWPGFLVFSPITGNRIVSLPLATSCNPLLEDSGEVPEFFAHIYKEFTQKKLKKIIIKTNDEFDFKFPVGKITKEGFCSVLDLDRPRDEIVKSFHLTGVRQILKKLDKSTLSLVEGKGEKEIKEFYKIYVNVRRRLGLLPLPYTFFDNAWKNFSFKNQIEFWNAVESRQTVGAMMCLKFKDSITVEYGGHLKEFNRVHPTHFLYWNRIKKAHDEKFRKFDFGKTSIENTSLLRFKMRWGAQNQLLKSFIVGESKSVPISKDKVYLKKIMATTVSLAPDAICSILGQVVYKHFI